MHDDRSTLIDYLATPYILTMEPVEGPDGHWTCRAEYPELEGCNAQAVAPEQAVDMLEARAAIYLRQAAESGKTIPVHRPALEYLRSEARARTVRDDSPGNHGGKE